MTDLTDQPGCWVVWVEDLTGEYVEVFDDELAAYRSAYENGGHICTHLTYVPFGMSVMDAEEVRNPEPKPAERTIVLSDSRPKTGRPSTAYPA